MKIKGKNANEPQKPQLNIPVAIVRGQLHFITDGDTVQCWLGEPKGNESEFIFEVHKMFAKDIIAGLTAVRQHCL